jgi:hypothetical protein
VHILTPSLLDHDAYNIQQRGTKTDDGPANALFGEQPALPQLPPGWPRRIGGGVITSGMTRTAPAGGNPPRFNCRLDWALFILDESVKECGVVSNVSYTSQLLTPCHVPEQR